MIPVDFPEANCIFEKPEDMTEEQYEAVPARTCKDSDGFPQVVTCWELSNEEREEVARTGKVYLGVVGGGLPAHWLSVFNPFH